MTKYHCPKCGSQFITQNSHKPNKPNRFSTFESTKTDAIYDDPGYDPVGHTFWDSYAIRYIITGCFICLVYVVFNWVYGWGLGWVGAILAIVAPLGLHLWTIYKMAPPKPKEKIERIELKVSSKDNSGYLHETLQDVSPDITDGELKGVADLIAADIGWSRGKVARYCKCSVWRARMQITPEMERLGIVVKKGNEYFPTEAGLALAESMQTEKGIVGMVGELIQK